MPERIAIIGLGYVGLPVALACARKYPGTIGFDIDAQRVASLRTGVDTTREIALDTLRKTSLDITADPARLAKATFFIVTVPTPVDQDNRPDLRSLENACALVGKALKPGDCVVFESTVYPGVTQEICGPALQQASGLQRKQFSLGYSPERINLGDPERTVDNIVKLVAGDDEVTLDRVASVYERFIQAGVHRVQSIEIAEAAKVIENTQRDLNVALMNELAMICERMGLRTKDVLAAAATKWNFVPFVPGLVGGHCLGVDPYYLATKAEQLGYTPQVILAGRRINDGMGTFIANKCVKLLSEAGVRLTGARIGVLGVTFKEDVSDLRNSRVPELVRELQAFGCEVIVHDPLYDLTLSQDLQELDALVLAVPHRAYLDMGSSRLLRGLKHGGVLIDVKSVLEPSAFEGRFIYWSL